MLLYFVCAKQLSSFLFFKTLKLLVIYKQITLFLTVKEMEENRKRLQAVKEKVKKKVIILLFVSIN